MPFTKKGKVAIIAFDKTSYASVVQWIERQIPVLNVGGSSPFGRAKIPVTLLGGGYFVAFGVRYVSLQEPERSERRLAKANYAGGACGPVARTK